MASDTLVFVILIIAAIALWFFFVHPVFLGHNTFGGSVGGSANPNTGLATQTSDYGIFKGIAQQRKVSAIITPPQVSIDDVVPRTLVKKQLTTERNILRT